MTTIKLKNGSGAPTAGDLVQGEPALDLTNKRLYTEDSGGTVIEVGTNPGEDVTFADNRKAIFGAGDDLQIYHDGSSRIANSTGNLIISDTDGDIYIQAKAGENSIRANNDGAVQLYYDNALKLATTSTGVDITGVLTVDGSNDAILRLSSAGTTNESIIEFGDSGDSDVGKIAYYHNGNTMRFYTGASEEMRLENDGDLHVDGNVVAYSTTVSDERLKDDVQDIAGALDTVDALRGVTYTWNAGSREGQRDYGVIAQEVEQVIPEIVHDTTMPLLGDEETVYKTVDYEKLCAVLINAVSELRAEVEALKNGASE